MNYRLISLTLVALSMLTASCSNNDSKQEETPITPEIVNNPASASDNASSEAMPVFTFEKENHEFGQITEGEKVSYFFKFKNTGNAPLVISSASASCGCTVPEYTKTPIKPGDGGTIGVTFDSQGRAGMNSKTVTIIANTIPNTKVLTISADVQTK